jgi:hypothetical protein
MQSTLSQPGIAAPRRPSSDEITVEIGGVPIQL